MITTQETSTHGLSQGHWHPSADESRLDFQHYEHDLSQLRRVLVESFRFTNSFEARTGFTPTGWATFFVNRPEQRRSPSGSIPVAREFLD
jgi:hypothetical protein